MSGKESAQGCIPKRLPGRPDEALGGGNHGPSAPGWGRHSVLEGLLANIALCPATPEIRRLFTAGKNLNYTYGSCCISVRYLWAIALVAPQGTASLSIAAQHAWERSRVAKG